MEKSDLRQWLFGLLIDCPMRKELAGCPMKIYRSKPATKKIDIAYEIGEGKLINLLTHHKKCLDEREYEIIKKHLTKVDERRYVIHC